MRERSESTNELSYVKSFQDLWAITECCIINNAIKDEARIADRMASGCESIVGDTGCRNK